jgi:hypothetical protein
MRKVLMITAAALAVGVTGVAAAPMHSGSFGGRGGGGIPRGGMMAAPQTSVSGRTNVSGNVRANNFAAPNNVKGNDLAAPNNVAAAPNYRNGPNYAYMHRDHDHGRGYGYVGGYGGGLYAFEPGYDYYDYDDEYAGDNCYQPRWVPTPYGMRWSNVWVCD